MTSPASPAPFLETPLFKEAAFVGGHWVSAPGRLAVRNPATGATIGHVPDLGADDTDRAIAAAAAAFPAWRALPAARRASSTVCTNRATTRCRSPSPRPST